LTRRIGCPDHVNRRLDRPPSLGATVGTLERGAHGKKHSFETVQRWPLARRLVERLVTLVALVGRPLVAVAVVQRTVLAEWTLVRVQPRRAVEPLFGRIVVGQLAVAQQHRIAQHRIAWRQFAWWQLARRIA